MILTDANRKIFNTEEIHRGTIVHAKKSTWDEGITGIVMETSETMLRIQFLPSIQNVINHCFVSVEETAEGLWSLRYSNDGLQTVQEYIPDVIGDEGETEGQDGS